MNNRKSIKIYILKPSSKSQLPIWIQHIQFCKKKSDFIEKKKIECQFV